MNAMYCSSVSNHKLLLHFGRKEFFFFSLEEKKKEREM